MVRLITFLGTGNYQPTRYVAPDGRAAPETPYVARALAALYEADEVLVLATDEAWTKHGAPLAAPPDGKPDIKSVCPSGGISPMLLVPMII